MTKMQAYAIAQETGNGFVANVILNWQRNSARRLKGLARLIKTGHDVRTGQFSIDTLIVDGKIKPWSYLETA